MRDDSCDSQTECGMRARANGSESKIGTVSRNKDGSINQNELRAFLEEVQPMPIEELLDIIGNSTPGDKGKKTG